MENHLKQCAESLKKVQKKLQGLADSATDPVEHGRISEALSFLGNAITAVSHAREEIATLPESAKSMN
jgi:hypothetical protein